MADERWDHDALERAIAFARDHGTTGFVILHRGEVVVETYWRPPADLELPGGLEITELVDGRTLEDVASAQKSITSVLIGLAIGRGLLDLDEAITTYLGPGWTGTASDREASDREASITVRHLMTMTSGLDDSMQAVAPPGQVWDYNLGAGYHMLKRVLAAVGGRPLDALTREWLTGPLGMDESRWNLRRVPDDLPDALRPYLCYPDGEPLEGFATSARDLATFGSAMLGGGRLGGVELGIAPGFLDESMRPATRLNPAYGMLWWINGQEWQLAPKQPAPVDGWLLPGAPADTVAALGALGRAVYIARSNDLVVVRIGANPGDDALAASGFGRDLWGLISQAIPASVDPDDR